MNTAKNADTDDDSERGERTAEALARIATLPVKFVPKRGTIFRKLFGASLKQYHKIGGGDALGLIAEPGQSLDIRPIKYRPPKECDDGERPGWVEKGGDKVWHAGAEGRVVDYMGNVPIVALERDSHVEAGWLKPRIGQAVELDNYDGLFTQPVIKPDIIGELEPGPGRAIPDGGAGNIVDVSVEDLGQYAGAEILDLDSGEGYDGMRIDFRKASAWAFETTTTEEMQHQEDRGFLRGQLQGANGPSVIKLLLICAAIILGVLAIVFIGPSLIGGDGGGSINPLMTVAQTAIGG